MTIFVSAAMSKVAAFRSATSMCAVPPDLSEGSAAPTVGCSANVADMYIGAAAGELQLAPAEDVQMRISS